MLKFKAATTEDLLQDQKIFEKISFGNTQPSPEDDRDFVACTPVEVRVEFPEEYLAPKTEILDQQVISSCVAHACATALAQGEENINKSHNIYSRGYIYGNRKSTDAQGEGMIIRQALKQLHNCGDVLYEDFPYNKSYLNVKELISLNKAELARKASKHKIKDFYRCYTDNQIKNTIMTAGGVIICAPVYENFNRDLHTPEIKKVKGYHAMVIVGWTKDNKWIVQNSWGIGWGYGGTLLMDNDYPICEYWGITVNVSKEDRKSFWQRVADFFIAIGTFFKNLFRKK